MTALINGKYDPNAAPYSGVGRPTLASGHRRNIDRQPGQLLWWHDAIIDEMLANPQLTKQDIAKRVGCSYAYLLVITNSDVFIARWRQRRDGLSTMLSETVSSRLHAVATESLDLILNRLKSNEKIPLSQLESLADKSLARLGYGQSPVAPAVTVHATANTAVQVTTPATREELERARTLVRVAESARSVGASAGLHLPSPEGVHAAPQVLHEEVISPSAEGEVLPWLEEK